jgi:uncharacterized membrane protein
MNIPSPLLPEAWLWTALLLYGGLLAVALRRAPWARLGEEAQRHVYFGSCVALMLLWTIKTPILPGIEYHYLGATLLTLMFGWPLAVLGMSVVLAGAVLAGGADWPSYPVNALVMGVVPVAVTHAILRAAERYLPANFFIYVFVVAYWGAALAVAAAVLAASALLWLASAYTPEQLAEKYSPLLVLLTVPEAFITGMLITLMVVYRPGWVGTFDDNRYLKGK